MPSLSARAIEMPASPIRKLAPFAEEAVKRGIRIYHLNIGQPDIETPEKFWNAISNYHTKVLAYSHSAGIEAYRRKLVEYYAKFNIKLDYSEIFITTGGSEAVLFAFFACMNPGDEVLIPEPFYTNYNGFAITAGIKIVPVTSHIEDGFALPPISEFEKLIIEYKPNAIMICNPNNPTGYMYSMDELMQIRDIVLKYDLYLFSDEVYREFVYDGRKHISVLELPGLEQHAVVLDSISKRYSACGARVGALITRNCELLNAVLKFGQSRLCPPTLEQVGALAAIDVDDSYFSEVSSEYVARRNLIVEALKKMEGVLCPNPVGAFYVVVRLPIDDSDKFCQWMLESFSHNGQTVMMAPANGFYATPGLGKDEVRIAYVLKKEDLAAAMECLEVALKEYPGRTI
jgi:aspartate aminotransferase